jgi:hypothetical protein
LAPRRNSLRQITNSLPLRNRSRRNRHILVMSPEPSKLFAIKTTAERDRHRILPKFVRSLQSCSQSPLLQ